MFFNICRMKRVTTPSQSSAKTIKHKNHSAGTGPPDFADAAQISGNATYEVSSIVLLCGKSD